MDGLWCFSVVCVLGADYSSSLFWLPREMQGSALYERIIRRSGAFWPPNPFNQLMDLCVCDLTKYEKKCIKGCASLGESVFSAMCVAQQLICSLVVSIYYIRMPVCSHNHPL